MAKYKKFKRWGGRQRTRYSKQTRILGMSMPQLIGFAVGMSNLDNNIPKNLILGAAVLPTGLLKGVAPISNFAKGVILGNMAQGLGLGIPGMGSQSSDARSF